MDLDEILSNPIAELFRKPKKFKKQVSGYCNSCSKFKSCKGGCNLITYALKGTLYDSDPLCPTHP